MTRSHSSRIVETSSPSSFRNNNTKQEEHPHLSGACIRSLVKQLSPSSSSTARSKDHHCLSTMTSTIPHDHQQQPQQKREQKPPVKKQVRRRTHTSRPYQERLLNMAEARREIVTALKIHRANMRQQSSRYQQQQQVQVVFQDQSQAVEAAPVAAPMSYGSFSSSHLHNSPLAHLIAGSTTFGTVGRYSSSSSHAYLAAPLLEAPAVGGLDGHGLEHLARSSLPAQPLGLNLSFQGFAGSVDGAMDCDDLVFGGIPLIQSSSPTASSYSAHSSPAIMEMATSTHGSPALSATEKYSSVVDAPAPLSPVLDDDDGQMHWGGARHGMEMEWSETAAAASAWWGEIILEGMESGGGAGGSAGAPRPEGGAVSTAAEGVVAAAAGGLPAEWRWLCDGAVGGQGAVTWGKPPDALDTTHVDGDRHHNRCYEGDRHSDDGEDITLPCMDDIGDIEGWDVEWFS